MWLFNCDKTMTAQNVYNSYFVQFFKEKTFLHSFSSADVRRAVANYWQSKSFLDLVSFLQGSSPVIV